MCVWTRRTRGSSATQPVVLRAFADAVRPFKVPYASPTPTGRGMAQQTVSGTLRQPDAYGPRDGAAVPRRSIGSRSARDTPRSRRCYTCIRRRRETV